VITIKLQNKGGNKMEGRASLMFERRKCVEINLFNIWSTVIILILILVLLK